MGNLANRTVLPYILLAAAIRVGLLAYTLVVSPTPVWPAESHSQLEAARQMLRGATDPPAYIDDIGLRYVHILLSPLGGPSLLRLQLLQVFLDTLMVFAVWRIGEHIGGIPVARVAALLYGIFLPQAILTLVPSYDAWATWAFVLPSWLLLEGLHGGSRENALFGTLAGSSTALLSTVRSTTVFYGLMAALVLFAFRRQKLAAYATVGWIAVILPLTFYKHQLYGELKPMRSNVAHVFWAGVGQFPNVYGVEATDESVSALYHRLTGKTDYNSQEYEIYLESVAWAYLRAHPAAYIGAAIRRTEMILFPRNYWGPRADQWSPEFSESLKLLQHSPVEFAQSYPLTIVLGIAGRILDWVVLPGSAIVGLVLIGKRPQLVAGLPLLYTVATLGPLYITARNTTNAYAATLPVCAVGLWHCSLWLGEMSKRRNIS